MEDRVVDRQDGAAGIAEDHVDALILQGFDDHFGTAHLLHHGPSPSGFLRISRNKKGPGEGPWVERRRGKSGQTRPISGAPHTIRRLRKTLAPDFGERTVVAAPFPVKQTVSSGIPR